MKTNAVVGRHKAPPGFVGRWVNFYVDTSGSVRPGGGYAARVQADAVAKPWRHDCVWVLVPKKGASGRKAH